MNLIALTNNLLVNYFQTVEDIYTKLNVYPLPQIDDMISELSKYKLFSTFDLKSVYHQISLIESDCKYTAFEANGKLYEFTHIPFGVKNGVATFQCKVYEFIKEENLKGAFWYLDNITIVGYNEDNHDSNVVLFLDAFYHRNFTLNKSKTIQSVESINILG